MPWTFYFPKELGNYTPKRTQTWKQTSTKHRKPIPHYDHRNPHLNPEFNTNTNHQKPLKCHIFLYVPMFSPCFPMFSPWFSQGFPSCPVLRLTIRWGHGAFRDRAPGFMLGLHCNLWDHWNHDQNMWKKMLEKTCLRKFLDIHIYYIILYIILYLIFYYVYTCLHSP